MRGLKVYYSVNVLKKNGVSVREISRLLKIAKSTVQVYLKIDEEEALKRLSKVIRKSEFDIAFDYIDTTLTSYPKLRASKLYRKVCEKHPEITSGKRAFSDYISKIRPNYGKDSGRNYQPISTDRPGYQVQVDIGEEKTVLCNGEKIKLYFVAFVFCFSRQKYIYIQDRPFNTGDFIRAHKEAFTYFGGIAEEYIYDQTKLVAICERFREVWFNQEFYQFAIECGFTPILCEGYDPESKGKVERVVQEVKNDFIYGESFLSLEEIRYESLSWLNRVNNTKHSVTCELPSVLYAEEKKLLKPYMPENEPEKRLVDKTGLISYKGNKYSVPCANQGKIILVKSEGDYLIITDARTSDMLTTHKLSSSKGNQYINNNHYRDYNDTVIELKEKCFERLKSFYGYDLMIEKLMLDNPKIVRDQLRGVLSVYKHNPNEDWQKIINLCLSLTEIKVSVISDIIDKTKKLKQIEEVKTQNINLWLKHAKPNTSVLDRSLTKYDEVLS